MQISVETEGPFQRIMKVVVPEQQIATELDSRLKSMTKTTRVQGFRPGRVPLKIIRQRYATQVRQEVIGQLVQSSFYEAVSREKLKLAGRPTIAPLEDRRGQGLAYTATFEIMPNVTLQPVAGLSIEKPVCEIQAADIDQMIENLRQQHRTAREVERVAARGDVVNIDFHGTVAGEDFAGGTAEGMVLELGSKRLLEGMEDGLIGKQAGDEVGLDLRFPEPYHEPQLAGKPVHFEIKVNAVSELVKPELNDQFFQTVGVNTGGEPAFRKAIRQQMQKELDTALRNKTRDAAMDSLYEANEMPLPNALVEAEIQRMQQQFSDKLKAQGLPVHEIEKLSEPTLFEPQARKRVALQLLAGEIIAANALQARPEAVRTLIEQNAANYEDSSAVINWYYSDEKRLAEVKAIVLEDAVVEWLLTHARVTERPLSFDEIVNNRQTEPVDADG